MGESREELILELIDALGFRAGVPFGIEQVFALPLDAFFVRDVSRNFGGTHDQFRSSHEGVTH